MPARKKRRERRVEVVLRDLVIVAPGSFSASRERDSVFSQRRKAWLRAFSGSVLERVVRPTVTSSGRVVFFGDVF